MSIQNSADRWIFSCGLNQPEPAYAFGMSLRPNSAERVVHWAGLAATLVEVTRTLITLAGLYVYLQKYYAETPNNMYNLWFSCMHFHTSTWEFLDHEIVTYPMKRLNKWVFNLLQELSWVKYWSVHFPIHQTIQLSSCVALSDVTGNNKMSQQMNKWIWNLIHFHHRQKKYPIVLYGARSSCWWIVQLQNKKN